MVVIGIGNRKGGVGSSALAQNFAALIQRSGCSVAIAETASLGEDKRWCNARCRRVGRELNSDMRDIAHLYVDDYSDLRFAPQTVGYDFVLLDYCNSRQAIEYALQVAQHWIAPFRPTDARQTLLLYDAWTDLRQRGCVVADTFSALRTFVPSAEDIAEEPEWAGSDVNGDDALMQLGAEAPMLHVLERRIRVNPAFIDAHGGRDVFGIATPDGRDAAAALEAGWSELLRRWKHGVEPVPPATFDIGRWSPLKLNRRSLLPLPAGIRGR